MGYQNQQVSLLNLQYYGKSFPTLKHRQICKIFSAHTESMDSNFQSRIQYTATEGDEKELFDGQMSDSDADQD